MTPDQIIRHRPATYLAGNLMQALQDAIQLRAGYERRPGFANKQGTERAHYGARVAAERSRQKRKAHP